MSLQTPGPAPASGRHHASDNVGTGIALTFGFASIVPFVEVAVKLLGETTSAPQIVWARCLLQIILIGGFLGLFVPIAEWRPRPLWPLVLRGIFLTSAAGFLYAGLAVLPLADSVAITFLQPMFLTVLAYVVLKDRVGWHRWAAVMVGFSGAFLIIGPNFERVGWAAILPALAALCYAGSAITTRRWASAALLPVFQFCAAATALPFLTVVILAGWGAGVASFAPRIPTGYELALLVFVGLGSATTNLLLTQAYRIASPSVIAPFLYLHIIGATLLGVAVFGQVPGSKTAFGAALVVGAGLFVWWRETRISRHPRPAAH